MIKGEITDDGDAPRTAVRPPVRAAIDQMSKRIIEMLQVDGRRSFADVARDLKLDEDAVEQRVLALVDSGVIQFTTISDPLRLGFSRQAMLGITVDKGLDDAVAERLAQIPEVAYLVLTAGGFDILAEIVGTSDAHISELVATAIRPTPGITAITTFVYDAVEKETYTWGVL